MDHNQDHPPQEEPEEEDQGSNYSPRGQPQQESIHFRKILITFEYFPNIYNFSLTS